MAKKLRWGILGTAMIATGSVIPGIRNSETGEVVGIASRSLEKARNVANQFGIPKAYGSYDELLADSDIDAVYIPLPNHLHMEWTIRAASAGKHVLCEKPAALDADEAQRMVDACKEAGVVFAEAFMYRHHPRYAKMKDIIRSGEIGEVRAIRGVFTYNMEHDRTNIRARKKYGGGGIYDVGVYPITAARMILETEPAAVTTVVQFSPDWDDCDMMTSGLLEFPGSIGLAFECGMWGAPRDTLEIVGATGRIYVPVAFRNDLNHQNFFVITADGMREEHVAPLDTYTLQADNMANAIWGKAPLLYPPEDAIRNMRIVDACYLSGRERKRVTL
jgi:predicted dehydrogenase